MNKTWDLKLFLSISLGLHLFVLSFLSILLPEFKIDPLPSLNIEVSLVPMVKEEKALSKKEEPMNIVEKKETVIKHELPMATQEEKKIPQVEKVEVTFPQKEQNPVPVPIVQSEVRVVSISEPPSFSTISEQRETEHKKEERIVIASIGNPVPSQSSSETAQMAMKSPSLSENEIAFIQPKYFKNPKPLYPQEARKKGIEGEVVLKVEVLSNGQVGEIELKRSSGHELLDRSAMVAVKQWKFVPAKKGETPVSVWVNIPVTFQLR